MKKILFIIMLFISLFFVGCKPETIKAINNISDIVSNYSYLNTNGFHYQSVQKYEGVIVNSKTIDQSIEQPSLETKTTITEKRLNAYGESQFSEEVIESFYVNGKKGEVNKDGIVWTDCSKEDYFKDNAFTINITYDLITNINIDKSEKITIITFQVKKWNIKAVLGTSLDLKEVNVEIKADFENEKLYGIRCSYSQDLTETIIEFVPSYEQVNVDIPE